jgi:hypothetical protein
VLFINSVTFSLLLSSYFFLIPFSDFADTQHASCIF